MSNRSKHEDKYTRSNRVFPAGNTVLLVIVIVIQIALLVFGFHYQPVPKDLIHQYDVTVEPLEDGSLDITYHLVWEALDSSEELTWVEIGMANEFLTVYRDSVSANIASYQKYTDDDYVALQLDFKEAYIGGDIVEFSFKVNQKKMLCKNSQGYFYEFVPGWFNSIQVENITLTWRLPEGEDRVIRGSLDYGEYKILRMQYGPEDFEGCQIVAHEAFHGEGAFNGLEQDREDTRLLCIVIAGLLIAVEVYIIDSFVSYNQGRGFLTGYGHHVHIYGRTNPKYITAREQYQARHRSSGGRSGGCACACACACAGGGRAGCSQKDTFGNRK